MLQSLEMLIVLAPNLVADSWLLSFNFSRSESYLLWIWDFLAFESYVFIVEFAFVTFKFVMDFF